MLISETDKCFGSTSLGWRAVLFLWFGTPARMAVRALGPSLTHFGLANVPTGIRPGVL